MKVSAFIPLILSSTAFAASRRSHSSLSSRQAQIKRGLVDVCVALDLDVTLLNVLPNNKPLVAGHLDLCLCLSVLPEFCKSNSVAKNVVNILGEDPAHDFFSNLINNNPSKKQCHYPDHCEPICDPKKPCHFGCKDGFVPDNAENPTTCVCPAPHTVCNGKCGSFPHGCGSQAVSIKKRAPTCSEGRTMCGVAGGSKGKAYDCVDTANDLESCGGCMAKSSFNLNAPVGRDCSSILGVDVVRCSSGACAVSSCKDGYVVSSSRDTCVKKAFHVQSKRDEIHDILDLCLQQGLLANVVDLAEIEEFLHADLHIARDFDESTTDRVLTILLEKGLIIGCKTLVELKAKLGLVVHIAREIEDNDETDKALIFLLEHGFVTVPTLLELKEKLGLIAHIGRRDEIDDLLDACVKQGLLAEVDDLAWIKEFLLADVHVARDVEDNDKTDSILTILLHKGLFIGVSTLAEVKAKLGLIAHIGRRDEIDDLLTACAAQGLIANVDDLVGIKEKLIAGLVVL